MKNSHYFMIAPEDLKNIKVFPFHLFIFNPRTKTYSPFLKGNQPLTNEKSLFLNFILSKGGKLTIQLNQRLTYLNHMGITEARSEDNRNGKSLIKQTGKEKIDIKSISSKQYLNQQLELVSSGDDFLPLILAVREEILDYSLRVSPTVSLAVFFAETLMQVDHFTNRVVAMGYMMAKELGFIDEKDLSDLICGSFLAHIGYTQLPCSLLKRPQLSFDHDVKSSWKKHPGYSIHLIQKSRCLLTEQCLKIIDQHHERVDGSGFPEGLKDKHCHQLSLILGCSSHLFELMMGRIDGKVLSFHEAIGLITRKEKYTGLEFEYGDTINETLKIILNRIMSREAA